MPSVFKSLGGVADSMETSASAAAQAHAAAMAAADGYAQPWVEKYRPKSVEDVAHQQDVVRALQNAIAGKDLPHMLFYGPPGTGKTSTALAVSRQLFGPELMKERVLELNASDERGIAVVRGKIKAFASVSVGSGSSSGHPCPPFKVIILDESDFMTKDAQQALRRVVEQYSKGTRFIFCCNYITRIIEPLTSRCAKFRFKPVVQDSLSNKIAYICKQENLVMEGGAMEALARVAGGDMRKAITFLQSAARFSGQQISADNLYDAAGIVPEKEIDSLMHTCLQSSSFRDVQEKVDQLVCDSYPVGQLLLQLQSEVMASDTIADAQKAEVCTKLAQVDRCLSDGASEELQLLDAIGFVHQVMKPHRA